MSLRQHFRDPRRVVDKPYTGVLLRVVGTRRIVAENQRRQLLIGFTEQGHHLRARTLERHATDLEASGMQRVASQQSFEYVAVGAGKTRIGSVVGAGEARRNQI